ncbi:TetR/AcrR family transcriptional regulator [Bacillus sp. FJAT-49736]|uniref:TetR/AcrR family transcriptional regulator n=1 Tax=Bacillus sp. FJAT-49736 TaxID=2833582 RepID=UPI001BC96501|nr:TetR/AcrR family transcriptional regulator [Bacillus sp. FJAT-49736]MBS4175061.1 helix-turn-helix transcriptional regulator [Bacillus sp. FJAT-49736]
MVESFSKNPSFELILSTTEKLIQEKGCKNTTLKDIIEHTGLSKGAIYHYVSSKDELLGLILQAKVEETNEAFQHAVREAMSNGESDIPPFQVIAKSLLNNSGDESVSNTIFIYLLSQTDNPSIEKILNDLYVYSFQTGKRWIEVGQERGVIPLTIDAEKFAKMFMILSYGMRVQKIVSPSESGFDGNDLLMFMFNSLSRNSNI